MERTVPIPATVTSLLHTISTCKHKEQLSGLEKIVETNARKYPGLYRRIYAAFDKKAAELSVHTEGVASIPTETHPRFTDDLQPGGSDPA